MCSNISMKMPRANSVRCSTTGASTSASPSSNPSTDSRRGQEVTITPFADLRKEVKGRIIAINPSIDEHGQVQVDAEVANDGTLTDGMNVRVAVRQKIAGQLVVPKSAVVIRDNLEVLFRYKEGRAQWTYVHTSLANSREYVVEANRDRSAELDPGDLIIVSGNLNLADGSEVTLTDNR